MNKYSDAMIAQMREIGSFDFNSATKFAEANGLTARSVVSKISALGLDYKKQDGTKRKAATKSNVRRKEDIIASVEASIGIKLASFSKMTVADLEALEGVFAE